MSSCYYDSEQNLYPPSACDTSKVSYMKDIDSILIRRCYSCHDDMRLGSVFDFQGHSDLVSFIDSHNFLGAIKHEAGVQAMPLGGDKIPDCEINFLEAWINQGKQNN